MGGSTPDKQVTTTRDSQTGASNSATSGSSTGFNTGATSGSQAGNTSSASTSLALLPDWLKPFVAQATGAAGGALQGAQGAVGSLDLSSALHPLEATARGDFLYGGPGQQPFIDAAVHAAMPGIFSAWGGHAGAGLEDAALNQSAVDAYARLYSDERSRQLSAAQAIPGIATLPADLQMKLAQLAGGLPGQFAPFLGRNDISTGSTNLFTNGTSSSNFGGTTSGATSGTTTSKGVQTQEQPIYQPPWWQTALGVASLGAGLALPGLSGVSAGGNIISGLGGLLGRR